MHTPQGSTYAPGMAKGAGGSDNVRGAAAGKSTHHGATFVTAGSLNAPGMEKAKHVSRETVGAQLRSVDRGGVATKMSMGSSSAPGMAHQSKAGREAAALADGATPDGATLAGVHTKSVDTGLSLFAMGSVLTQVGETRTRTWGRQRPRG